MIQTQTITETQIFKVSPEPKEIELEEVKVHVVIRFGAGRHEAADVREYLSRYLKIERAQARRLIWLLFTFFPEVFDGNFRSVYIKEVV